MTGEQPIQWMTVQEAADVIRVSRRTIYKLIAEGQLPSVRLGRSRRVPANEIDALRTRLLDEQVPQ